MTSEISRDVTQVIAANGHFGRDGADFPLHFPRGEGSEFLRIVQLQFLRSNIVPQGIVLLLKFQILTPSLSEIFCLSVSKNHVHISHHYVT